MPSFQGGTASLKWLQRKRIGVSKALTLLSSLPPESPRLPQLKECRRTDYIFQHVGHLEHGVSWNTVGEWILWGRANGVAKHILSFSLIFFFLWNSGYSHAFHSFLIGFIHNLLEGCAVLSCAMLSLFSHVRLCVTQRTVAHQAPLFTGFSRQEYWSGLPFPSPIRRLLWKYQGCYAHTQKAGSTRSSQSLCTWYGDYTI